MFGNCPHCGAQVSAKLVERILDPSAEESCPTFAEVETVSRQLLEAFAEVVSDIPNVTVHIGLPAMDYESAQA